MSGLLVLLILQSIGATIRRDGDGLVIDAPPGAITPELKHAVAHCKPELLAMLAPAIEVQP